MRESIVRRVIADFAASSPEKAAAVAEFPFGSVVRADDYGRDFYVLAWGERGATLRVVPFPVSLDMAPEKFLEAHAESVTVCAHCARKYRPRAS